MVVASILESFSYKSQMDSPSCLGLPCRPVAPTLPPVSQEPQICQEARSPFPQLQLTEAKDELVTERGLFYCPLPWPCHEVWGTVRARTQDSSTWGSVHG